MLPWPVRSFRDAGKYRYESLQQPGLGSDVAASAVHAYTAGQIVYYVLGLQSRGCPAFVSP